MFASSCISPLWICNPSFLSFLPLPSIHSSRCPVPNFSSNSSCLCSLSILSPFYALSFLPHKSLYIISDLISLFFSILPSSVPASHQYHNFALLRTSSRCFLFLAFHSDGCLPFLTASFHVQPRSSLSLLFSAGVHPHVIQKEHVDSSRCSTRAVLILARRNAGR